MHVEYLKKQIIFSLSSICSLYFFCFLVLIHSSIGFLSLILNHILFFLALFSIFFLLSLFLAFFGISLLVYLYFSLHLCHHLSILILYSLCSFSASLLCLLWLLFSFFLFHSHFSFVLAFFTFFLIILSCYSLH